jgi:UbiD family decarboxylase
MAKDLRSYLAQLQEALPGEIRQVDTVMDPKFEISAVVEKLEDRNEAPLILFNKVKNHKGELSDFRVAVNVFSTRPKCTVALGLHPDQWRMETSLEFARLSKGRVKPVIIDGTDAPVKEVVRTGDQVDLYDLPILVHNEMDGHPNLVDAIVAADPDTGCYNSSHHRQMVKGKDRLGVYMSPRHLWNYWQRAAKRGQSLPIAHVVGHHPGFYIGTEALVDMDDDEYEVIGAVLQEPLRLVPSEAYGERLLVPADAELVIEGEILPDEYEAEGPFGEFSGYYGPQRWAPVVKVTAITHRKDPLYLNIMAGRADHRVLGGIPKEGGLFEMIKLAVPTAKAIHLPFSGCCRFSAYISIEKLAEGEGMVAAIAPFPYHDELKLVIVVDDDVDPFNEREVLWAATTRAQADKNMEIIRNIRGGTLDPSSTIHGVGAKLIIDATRPLSPPFAERLRVPLEIKEKINLEALDWA